MNKAITTNIGQLKMLASDGKLREIDCANAEIIYGKKEEQKSKEIMRF